MSFEHRLASANGIEIHYVRQGSGLPLVLLHGWPEFWLVWRKVIGPLSDRFDVVAPDLRGFGQSSKPAVPAREGYRVEDHAADLLGLADALGFDRFGLVSHDVGAYVAQTFARQHAERLVGLFFFDCPYPGIGQRWAEPGHLGEIWYQSFHQLPAAVEVVGASREATERYFRHFLSHWAHDPGRVRGGGHRRLGRQLLRPREPPGRFQLVHRRPPRPARAHAARRPEAAAASRCRPGCAGGPATRS